jgi:hypothetical protein
LFLNNVFLLLWSSPDSSENPFERKPIFLLIKNNDQRKFVFDLQKKGFWAKDCSG